MAHMLDITTAKIRFCILISAKNPHTISSMFCPGITTHITGKASIKALENTIK